MTAASDPDLLALPWRTGGHPGLAVLALVGDGRYALVGMMASAEIAALVVEAHNEQLAVHPGSGAANRLIRDGLAECGEIPGRVA